MALIRISGTPVTEHPVAALNASYLVESITFGGSDARQAQGSQVELRFRAIPVETPYRKQAARVTSRPGGPQTGVVVGPSGEEIYPDKSEDQEGLGRFFKQFSFPGHVGSHVTPETPGSIHEGGELGYSLSHAFGAALDNPDLLVACVVGDGEAETGPLATA